MGFFDAAVDNGGEVTIDELTAKKNANRLLVGKTNDDADVSVDHFTHG